MKKPEKFNVRKWVSAPATNGDHRKAFTCVYTNPERGETVSCDGKLLHIVPRILEGLEPGKLYPPLTFELSPYDCQYPNYPHVIPRNYDRQITFNIRKYPTVKTGEIIFSAGKITALNGEEIGGYEGDDIPALAFSPYRFKQATNGLNTPLRMSLPPRHCPVKIDLPEDCYAILMCRIV